MVDIVDDTDTSALKSGYKKGKKKAKQGIAAATQYGEKAQGALDKALPAYEDLYGMGKEGIEGYGTYDPRTGQAGVDAFKGSLDYLLSRDAASAGLDAIGRSYAGTGQVGRSMIDAMDYMNRFDSGILSNARNYYSPYFGLGQGAAGGMANVYGNKAQAYLGTGQNVQQGWNNMANMNVQQGQDMTNIGMYDTAQDWGALMGLGNLAVGGAQAYFGRK